MSLVVASTNSLLTLLSNTFAIFSNDLGNPEAYKFRTKKDCILDYVTTSFRDKGARYTDIIKFAYYLGAQMLLNILVKIEDIMQWHLILDLVVI